MIFFFFELQVHCNYDLKCEIAYLKSKIAKFLYLKVEKQCCFTLFMKKSSHYCTRFNYQESKFKMRAIGHHRAPLKVPCRFHKIRFRKNISGYMTAAFESSLGIQFAINMRA